jgi:protocatechuate 3,4-dioxygenase beta subunit
MATTEDELTAEVIASFAATPDARLKQIMESLVKHLHSFAKEVRLTDEEWFAGIKFLTDSGDMCSEVRQEFILLSDTLGLSSLVDLINHAKGDDLATEPTILGPFHVANAPLLENGASIVRRTLAEGEPAIVRGRVLDIAGKPIAGAIIDVWQTDANGMYDIQDSGDVNGNLRGRFKSDSEGRYEFKTIRPVPYPIPADGPVGKMLRSVNRHEWRAAHIHAIVEAPGFTSVTTHIFDKESKFLDSDTVFGVKGSLIKTFIKQSDGDLLLDHDFVLVKAK